MPNKFERQLDQIKRQKKLFIALILFFVVILTWILVSIFASQTKQAIGPELIKLAEPLVPNLNTQLLDDLQEKRYFSDEQLEKFSIYVLLSERGEDAGKVTEIINQETIEQEEAEEVEEVEEAEEVKEAKEVEEVEEAQELKEAEDLS